MSTMAAVQVSPATEDHVTAQLRFYFYLKVKHESQGPRTPRQRLKKLEMSSFLDNNSADKDVKRLKAGEKPDTSSVLSTVSNVEWIILLN